LSVCPQQFPGGNLAEGPPTSLKGRIILWHAWSIAETNEPPDMLH
jgi:hypothetical protein